MTSSTGRSTPTATTLAGILVVLTAANLAVGGGGKSSLQIQDIAVSGSSVHVTLVNPGRKAMTDTLWVKAVVDGHAMVSSSPVTVEGGQTATVGVSFPAPVEEAITAGVILDDGSPF